MSPPSSDRSASTECGGKRSLSVARRREFSAVSRLRLMPRARRAGRVRLALGDSTITVNAHVDVGVQMQLDLVLAERRATARPASAPRCALSRRRTARRPRRCPSCRSSQTACPRCRPRPAAAAPCPRAAAARLRAPRPRPRPSSRGRHADLLELGDVVRRRERRLTLRYQIIARVTRLDLDAVADAADVVDLFQQNHFHCSTLSS